MSTSNSHTDEMAMLARVERLRQAMVASNDPEDMKRYERALAELERRLGIRRPGGAGLAGAGVEGIAA